LPKPKRCVIIPFGCRFSGCIGVVLSLLCRVVVLAIRRPAFFILPLYRNWGILSMGFWFSVCYFCFFVSAFEFTFSNRSVKIEWLAKSSLRNGMGRSFQTKRLDHLFARHPNPTNPLRHGQIPLRGTACHLPRRGRLIPRPHLAAIQTALPSVAKTV